MSKISLNRPDAEAIEKEPALYLKSRILRFRAEWFEPEYPAKVQIIDSTFFKGRGYSYSEIGECINLEVGETKTFPFHTITRIQ